MADNIVDISDHLPAVDAELVDYLKSLVVEARNGRLTGFAMIYIDGEGGMQASYLLRTQVEQIAAGVYMDLEAIKENFE